MATVFADPSRCPDCRAPLGVAPERCPGCGLILSGPAATQLFQTLAAADRILFDMRVASAPAAAAPPTVARDIPDPQDTPPSYPPPSARPRRGLSAATVPQILLGLGALCLLVAAVVFLALAWDRLGVGGRTAVLVAMTVAAGGFALWLERRGLRWAAESLAVVSLGLLALDLVGADNAGWFGDLADDGLTVLLGGVLTLAALAGSRLSGRDGKPLVSTQLVAPTALAVAGVGLTSLLPSAAAAAVLAIALLVVVAWCAGPLSAPIQRFVALLLVLPWWLSLLGMGLDRVIPHLDMPEYLAGLRPWPFVAAAAVTAGALWVLRRHEGAWWTFGGITGSILAMVVLLPWLNETADPAALASLGLVAVALVVLLAAPHPWRTAAVLPGAAVALVPSLIALVGGLMWLGAAASSEAGTTWDAALTPATDVNGHPALVPITVAVVGLFALAVLRLTSRAPQVLSLAVPVMVTALAVALVTALTGYPLPRVVVVGAAIAAGVALAVGALRTERRDVSVVGLLGGAVLLLLGLYLALPSAGLVLLTCLVVTGVALAVARVRVDATESVVADLVAPAALAGAVLAACEILDVADGWRGVAVVLVVGVTFLARPGMAWLVSGSLTAALAGLNGVNATTWHSGPTAEVALAVTLTVAGAAYVATALLHEHRRWLAVPGGVLLAAASWVRLWDLDVDVIEAYTLPSALVLVGLGLWHLRRHPEATTRVALTPGLLLATVPSLLRVFVEEPISWRALLLGVACLALVLGGARVRWSAPLVVGAVVGALLVLREAGPYAADLPPWVLIAVAGTLLTLVGITWEQRVREVRAGSAWLARLR